MCSRALERQLLGRDERRRYRITSLSHADLLSGRQPQLLPGGAWFEWPGSVEEAAIMGMKENLDQAAQNVRNAVEHARKDVVDAVNEAKHRSEAAAERSKRDVAGDEMSPGEYAESVITETVRGTQADIDRAKRDLRDA